MLEEEIEKDTLSQKKELRSGSKSQPAKSIYGSKRVAAHITKQAVMKKE